jgi:predicted DNA-binding transcriptional regulator AlpA
MERKLLTFNEVKKIVSLSTSSIIRLIKKGKFPAPVDVGVNVTRWKEDEIREWINNLQPKQLYTNQFKTCKCCKFCRGGMK